MIVHAEPADLATWTGADAPANAVQLLRSASLLVDEATLTAVYVTGADGHATDSTVLAALRDATCAQAAAWAALGIDPAAGPAGATAKQVVSKTIGSARIEYDKGTATGQSATGNARQAAVTDLCAEATQILAAAGLLTGAVWVRG